MAPLPLTQHLFPFFSPPPFKLLFCFVFFCAQSPTCTIVRWCHSENAVAIMPVPPPGTCQSHLAKCTSHAQSLGQSSKCFTWQSVQVMHNHLDSPPSVLPGKQITAVVIESFSCPSWLYEVTVEMHLPIDSTVPAHSTVTRPARCLTS